MFGCQCFGSGEVHCLCLIQRNAVPFSHLKPGKTVIFKQRSGKHCCKSQSTPCYFFSLQPWIKGQKFELIYKISITSRDTTFDWLKLLKQCQLFLKYVQNDQKQQRLNMKILLSLPSLSNFNLAVFTEKLQHSVLL